MADNINEKLQNVRTMEDIVNLLSILFTNLNNQNEMYYDMFLNPTPLDLNLERYDENGQLVTVTLPNVAKMRVTVYSGAGNPNGIQTAAIGALYIDTISRSIYYKATGSDSYGWQMIWSTANLIEGINYLSPRGDGSNLQNLNVGSVTGGTLPVQYGGTGVKAISGIIKGNGTSAFTSAIVDEDYLAPSSFTGLIMSCPFDVVPDGWLICDNTIYDISVRPELTRLCRKLGNRYGGDGVTTFGVPNLVGAYADPETGETKYRGRYVKYGMPSEVGVTGEAHVGEHTHVISGSTANDGAHTHNRGSMNITGNIYGGAAGWKTWGPAWDGCFGGSSVGTHPVQGGWDNDWGRFGNTFNFNAANSWTGETSSTPHSHSLNITASSGGYGTNDVDHLVMIPIIKY